MRFIIIFSRGQKWREGIRLPDQPWMPEHAVYVQERFNKGEVLIAGPFDDHSGGAILMDAEDKKAVLEFVQNDPAVVNEVFAFELKPWAGIMNKYENRNPNFDQGYIDYKHSVQKELNII